MEEENTKLIIQLTIFNQTNPQKDKINLNKEDAL